MVGLERVRKFHSEVVKVGGSTELKAGDVLLLDVFAPPEDMEPALPSEAAHENAW